MEMVTSKNKNKEEEKGSESESFEDRIQKAEDKEKLIEILKDIPDFFENEEAEKNFEENLENLKKEIEVRKEDEGVVNYGGFDLFSTKYGLRSKIRQLFLGEEFKEEIESTEEEEKKTEEEKTKKEKEEEKKKKEEEAQKKRGEEREMIYSTKIDLMGDDDDSQKEEKKKLKETVKFVNKEKIAEECQDDFKELLSLSAQEEGKKTEEKKEEKKEEEKGKEGEEEKGEEAQIEIDFEELEKGTSEYQEKLQAMSEKLGLPEKEIEQIVNNQKNNLIELRAQQHQKKEKKWKKIGKTLGIYAVLGGVGLLTGGLGLGIGLGAARIVDTIFKGRKGKKDKEKARQEVNEILSKTREATTEASAEEDRETQGVLDSFYDNIFVELSLTKRNQIEEKSEGGNKLVQEIKNLEKNYNPQNAEDKKKLAELYQKRRDEQKGKIKEYLQAKGLEEGELENRVKLSIQLVELDDNQKIMELDFAKRKANKVAKIFSKLDSILSHRVLLGGEAKEKIITAGIFAVAGVLARSCPIVRNVLMAYAGMKLGSAAADLMFGRSKEARNITSEQISLDSNSEDLNRAKAQLLDPKFKEKNPLEHAKLQEKIFSIDRARMEKVLGEKEEKKEEEKGKEGEEEKKEEEKGKEGEEEKREESTEKKDGYIVQANKELEEAIKKRRAAQGRHKGAKVLFGIAGGVAGWFVGEWMNERNKVDKESKQPEEPKTTDKSTEKPDTGSEKPTESPLAEAEREAQQKLEEQEQELARLKAEKIAALEKLNEPVVVEKGDTVWGVCEEQLEKRVDNWEELSRAEKDYLIDWYKDKVVANPAEYGIGGGNASSLKIGSEIKIAELFKDPNEMTEVLAKAQGLSPEQVQNIMANRDLIGNVMSQKLEEVPGDKLLEAVRVMGGNEQAGPGFIAEIEKRATEVLGEAVTPEQTQVILNNPEVFGEIMTADGNLTEVPDNILRQGFELIAGKEDMTVIEIQNNVYSGSGKIHEEFWTRLKGLQNNLHQTFGENIGINEIGSSGGIINTPIGQELKETGENIIAHFQEQKEDLIKLKDSPGLLRKIFTNVDGKIEKLSKECLETIKGFNDHLKSQADFIEKANDLSKTYKDLLGGDFFEKGVELYGKGEIEKLKEISNEMKTFLEQDYVRGVPSSGGAV
jgi:hypothetical protein